MKYLFLGGTADGKSIETNDVPRFRVPVYEKQTIYIEPMPLEVEFKTHDYDRVRFRDSDGTEFVVYQYEDDILKPIARLIKGYQAIDKVFSTQ